MRKTYIGIVRDHSMSMQHLSSGAMKDFNTLIASIKNSAGNEIVYVTTVECGAQGGTVVCRDTNIPLERVAALTKYDTPGDAK